MLVARDLECETNGSILQEVCSISLEKVSIDSSSRSIVNAHQVEDTGGALLLVSMLDEVEETLSSLAGPCGHRMRNLRLLAAEVFTQARNWDRLLTEPKILLGEAESAALWLAYR